MYTLNRHNGFYTVQALFSITLTLPLHIENYWNFLNFKKQYLVYCFKPFGYEDTGSVLINHVYAVP